MKSKLAGIQGLRALAVCLVVAYHIWPRAVPGGFIGVDVFFVISGFLMTRLLADELLATGGIDVREFYVRRVRRIVPAAAAVIVATAVVTPWLPATRWVLTAQEIVASALFIENWLLASRAVDYLMAGVGASMLQHFWSLAVEMQFYLLWPFYLLGTVWVARRAGVGAERAVSIGVILAVAIGFVVSIMATAAHPSRAYFATEVRVWEFAIGGLAALAMRSHGLTGTLGMLALSTGLVAIVASAFFVSAASPFPGWVATVPCVGALLVILGSPDCAAWPSRLLSSRPARVVGDLSYSIYLWHWPLIVFVAATLPAYRNVWYVQMAIVAATLTLSVCSKFMIEDRMRSGVRSWFRAGAVPVAAALASIAIPLVLLMSEARMPADRVGYPGAAVLASDMKAASAPLPFVPSIAFVRDDLSVSADDGCHGNLFDIPAPCTYGAPAGQPHIVLVGDSHAAQLSSAFKPIAERRGWRYTHLSKGGCPFTAAAVPGRAAESCAKWNEIALRTIIELKPDYVFATQYWGYDLPEQELTDGLLRRWRELESHGIRIIGIRDIPSFPYSPPECLAAGRKNCDKPREKVVPRFDPVTEAAGKSKTVPLIDLTDLVCEREMCRVVVGNVLAWWNQHHLTNTYVLTMVPFIETRVVEAMAHAAPAGLTSAPQFKNAATR